MPVPVVPAAANAAVDRHRVTDSAARRWPPSLRLRRRLPPRRAVRDGEPRARRRGGEVRVGGGGGGGGGGRHPPFPRRDRGGDPASFLKTYETIPISSSPRSCQDYMENNIEQ